MGQEYLIRPYADLPASFQYLGNQGDVLFVLGDARGSVCIKDTFIRSEILTRVPDDVTCDGWTYLPMLLSYLVQGQKIDRFPSPG